jgi:hypothetical protein
VSPRARRLLVLATGLAGLVLMIAFDRPLTRVLGVLSLFAFIVAGLFVVADREFLGAVEPDTEPSRLPSHASGIPSATSTTTP